MMKAADPVLASGMMQSFKELIEHDEGWLGDWLHANPAPFVMSMEGGVPTYWLHPALTDALERRRAIGLGGD